MGELATTLGLEFRFPTIRVGLNPNRDRFGSGSPTHSSCGKPELGTWSWESERLEVLTRFRLLDSLLDLVPGGTLEDLCVEATFSSLFQPQFRAHEPGRKIAELPVDTVTILTLGHLARKEVQLREVSTLHVKPLFGPENLAADEPHEHSESCTTPSPTARLLWHLQRALHQAACHAACARCLNIA